MPSKFNSLKHGHTAGGRRSPEYVSWLNMIARCTNPKHPGWKWYGGKGVRVCDRWLTFENFFIDMGERPTGKSIDRINSHGAYEPGNCRWATSKEQNRNSASYKGRLESHGNSTRYRDGCRCTECCAANSIRLRIWRAKQKNRSGVVSV